MGELQAWVEWSRGPFFLAALIFMILGLVRHAGLTLFEMANIICRAGDKSIPWKAVITATIKWLFPAGQLSNRLVFGLTTLIFHICVILTPVFLAGHIALWKEGTGLSWPAIPNSAADVLTLAAVLTAVFLVLQRAFMPDSRSLSRFQDYALPFFVAVPFATGFLVMHPGWNPFSYEAALLAHVMSANILFILVPLTKLSHMVLLPFTQLVSELAWHFPADTGSRVAAALGKEKEPI